MPYLPKQPFRFLELPKEVRLIIYDFLPDHVVRTKYIKSIGDNQTSSFTLISVQAPKAIRLTCRLINDETRAILAPAAEKRSLTSTLDGHDNWLYGPGPRIETDCHSLCSLAAKKGIIDAIAKCYHLLRQSGDNETISRAQAGTFLNGDLFDDYGYVLVGGSREQSLICALGFIWQAAQTLSQRSKTCSLDDFQITGCTPGLEDPLELRGPLVQIALSLQDTITESCYYNELTEFCGLIEELESTFLVGIIIHLLVMDREEKREEAWKAVVHAILDVIESGEMTEGVHGFVRQGVFGLDTTHNLAYEEFWCGSERS